MLIIIAVIIVVGIVVSVIISLKEKHYKKSFFVKKDEAVTWKNIGQQNLEKEDFDQAIVFFNRSISNNPNDAEVYYCRSVAYYGKAVMRKDNVALDLSIKDCDHALKLNPNFAEAYSARGGAYFFKGEFDKAIEDCNCAIKLNFRDFAAYSNRGGAYIMKNEFDLGIKDMETSLQINPNQPNVSEYIKMARKMQEDHKKSLSGM